MVKSTKSSSRRKVAQNGTNKNSVVKSVEIVENIVINVIANVIKVIYQETKFNEFEPNNKSPDRNIFSDVEMNTVDVINVIDCQKQQQNKFTNQTTEQNSDQKQQHLDLIKRKIDDDINVFENIYLNDDRILEGKVTEVAAINPKSSQKHDVEV